MTTKAASKSRQARSSTRARARDSKANKPKPMAYSAEIATRICEALAVGQSVATICKANDMPSETTVYQWLYRHQEFLAQYRGARVAGCERLADELFEIVDDASHDWVKRETASGKVEVVADHEHISRSRLRFDARRWYLSKIVPKIFGDHASLVVSGDLHHTVASEPTSDLEIARRHAFLLGLGEIQLSAMGFPELAKLMKIEDALRARGIDPAAPFDKPAPPPEFLALPAPAEIELNPQEQVQPAPAAAASEPPAAVLQTQPAEDEDPELVLQNRLMEADIRRQTHPIQSFVPFGPRRPWRR